jgi:hypothetical protein
LKPALPPVPEKDGHMAKESPTRSAGSTGAEFADEAGRAAPGFVRELWDFLRSNKKWWLAPIILVLVVLGALIMIGGTAAAPFIYTLF